MSKEYNITRSLVFRGSSEEDYPGYWQLDITVNSVRNVNPRPFLLEKNVDAGSSIAESTSTPVFIRTLLESDSVTDRTEEDTQVQDYYSWLSYRSNQVTRYFYTYELAKSALESTLAVLKSNASVYDTPQPTARLVAINLSAKKSEASLESLVATKGDTISLQIVGRPATTQLISSIDDSKFDLISPLNRVVSGACVVKLLSSDITEIGLVDSSSGTEYKMPVTMLDTPLEDGSVQETIR